MEKNAVKAHISVPSAAGAAAAVLLILGAISIFSQLQEVIVLFLLAVFLAAILDPGVSALRKIGVPQGVAILLHYAVFLGLAAFFLVSFVPLMAEQLIHIATSAQVWLTGFFEHPNVAIPFLSENMNSQGTVLVQTFLKNLSIERLPDAIARIGHSLTSADTNWFSVAVSVTGSAARFLLDTLIVFVFAFFLQTQKKVHSAWIKDFLSPKMRAYIDAKGPLVHRKISQWIRGQLLLCFCIGALTCIVLLILRMPYVLTLSILAGVMEAVPYMGPLFAAIPAVLIAFAGGGFTWGLIVAAAYYGIQFMENNFIVPIVMKNAVDLSAVAIMMAMLIGVSFPTVLDPILGILLSIPLTAILSIFLDDLQQEKAEFNK